MAMRSRDCAKGWSRTRRHCRSHFLLQPSIITDSLKADTTALRGAAAASMAELAALRKEVAELRRALDAAPNPMLQRYLEEATEFAESLADPFEDPELLSEDSATVFGYPAIPGEFAIVRQRSPSLDVPESYRVRKSDPSSLHPDDPVLNNLLSLRWAGSSLSRGQSHEGRNAYSRSGHAKPSTPEGASERPKLPRSTDEGVQVSESTSLQAFLGMIYKMEPQYAKTIQEKSKRVLLVESYEHRLLDHYFSPISTEIFDRKLKDFAEACGMIFVDASETTMESTEVDERTFVRIHILERYLDLQDKRLALLDYIFASGHSIPEIRFLLQNGADVNARIEVGRAPCPPVLLGGTILHALAYEGRAIRLLPTLVKAGIDLDARTQGGLTAAQIALGQNKRDELRALTQSGASLQPIEVQNHDFLRRLSRQQLMYGLSEGDDFAANQLAFDGKLPADWKEVWKCGKWHRPSRCRRKTCPAWRKRMNTEYGDVFEFSYQDLSKCLGIHPVAATKTRKPLQRS